MTVKTLSRSEAQSAMQSWIMNEDKSVLPDVNQDYKRIRQHIQLSYNRVVADSDLYNREYNIDVRFALDLYEYLNNMSWFSLRVAANNDFWSYMSLIVVPDVVGKRWGNENEDHYWRIPGRIWLRQLWWYIHLSWQGDQRKTRSVILKDGRFSMDTILNLVERPGRRGTYTEVYRLIMYYYSIVTPLEMKKFRQQGTQRQYDLFRTIMKINTAKSLVIEPALYLGGEKEYVKSLFYDAGVNL